MSETSGYKTLLFEVNDGVGHLILNQPPSNRMSLEFFSELAAFTSNLQVMKDIRALVISGKGRHFSSGADLEELTVFLSPSYEEGEGRDETVKNFMNRNIETFRSLWECRVPVIAAIRGVCLGSASELAMFCHFRFCGDDALFGLPESTFGLMPGIGGVSRMVSLAGPAMALELALKGNTFGATDAIKYCLADRIIPKREVVSFALQFASSLPGNYRKEKSPLYLQRTVSHA